MNLGRILLVASLALAPLVATAQTAAKHGQPPPEQNSNDALSGRRAERKAFRRGVCVGQNLAEAGIDVAATDLKNLSDEQKATFKAAIEACKSLESTTEPSSDQAPSAADTSTDASS